MSTTPTILVTSAGGKTGIPVTLQLIEKGMKVRAFLRQSDHRARLLKRAGAEIFIGNQYALSDMRRAMDGIDRAYICAPTAPNGLHFNAVAATAIAEAGLEHVVTLGQWLSSADHPSLFTRETYLGDKLIGMASETAVTQVNPGWFADNYLMGLKLTAQTGILAMPLGDGAVKKNAPPSNEDIASVAAEALTDPQTHSGKTYRPTGPELLSPNEIAAAIGRALGRKVRYMDVSERMMTKALRAHPPGNFSDAAVSQLAIYAEEYRRGSFAVNAPTEHVQSIGGRTPERFESIVRRRIAEDPSLKPSLAGRVSGIAGFAKILVTPAMNLDRVQSSRDYVRIGSPAFAQDTPEWVASHT